MLPTAHTSIILIGMPGSGKSTIGVILAKLLSKNFVDTDVLIQTQEGRSLQAIVDSDGYLRLRTIEEGVLLRFECRNCVIATGGSAVYSDKAMARLKKKGIAVFLDVDMATLKSRVHDYETRGLAKRPDQTIDDLFAERSALYRKYADMTVNCVGLNHEEVCERIVKELRARR